MKIEKIKPIPKYILKLIQKAEKNNPYRFSGYVRFYSYLAKNDGELVKVIVACKNRFDSPRWRCKQVVVHGVHSKECFLKDIVFHFMGNYSVGWYEQGLQKYRKWYESEEEHKALYTKFGEIAKKYLPLQKDGNNAFVVMIARSPQDLIREGAVLHHCVGHMNYDQKFVREESLIFFVRNINNPDTPFVTMEYSLKNKKVLQCYGNRNSRPDDEVLTFVNKKWLPFANRQLKKIQAAA